MAEERKKLTIPDLAAKKAAGERLVMVAVGEVLSAAWAERPRPSQRGKPQT